MARSFLVVLCTLAAVEAQARCIENEEAAKLIAALFPTAKLDRWKPFPAAKPCLHVGPVQRDGKWGYVDTAHVLPFPGGQKLFFVPKSPFASDRDPVKIFMVSVFYWSNTNFTSSTSARILQLIHPITIDNRMQQGIDSFWR